MSQFYFDLYLSVCLSSSPWWQHTHYVKLQKAFWCQGLSVSCFPSGTQSPWAWLIMNPPPTHTHTHTNTSSLFYQGSSTPPAILVSSSHPLLLTSHPVLLFLILSSFFWSCSGISLLLLHPFSSSPSFLPLSLSSCWALNHPLTPSLLARKLPFPFLS